MGRPLGSLNKKASKSRLIIMRLDSEGWSQNEIARYLAITQGSVSRHLNPERHREYQREAARRKRTQL